MKNITDDIYEAFDNGAGFVEIYELAEEKGLNALEVVEYLFGKGF